MVITKADRAIDAGIMLILAIIGVICFFPLLYVFTVSITPLSEVMRQGGFVLIPVEVTGEAYKSLFKDGSLVTSMWVTLKVTVLGTVLSMVLTTLTAYPLSKRMLPGRKVFTTYMVFTMLFSGGMIPSYLLVKSLGMLNTIAALIFPAAISTYNTLVMKAFFESLPEELFEAARIDGAGESRVLFQIAIPISIPVFMTVGLFYMVSYWNMYFASVMYITDQTQQTLQVVLRRMLLAAANTDVNMIEVVLPSSTLQMAAVIVACAPIIAVYPFIQKYFTKGMMLGAVKG